MISDPDSHPAYTLIERKYLPLWASDARVYRHRSGARVLSLCNDDDHKTFGIVFPTPPTQHNGLPHILEHCVLCGSDKYRVKEPFKEMLKTSLQTFLNAFTYPDRTCYPVSSRNLQDFHHLMDVYLDAVFFPRLIPAVLGQEGWRLQWNEKKELEFQGVVFNEMKGVYASADARLDEVVRRELFADTPYRFDYGGHPAHIPELDFDTFIQFHRDHYHPANALIGFYGNDDPASRLERLHEVLERIPPGPLPEPIGLQSPWTTRREVRSAYPAVEGSDEGIFCQLNWLLPGDQTSPESFFTAGMASSLLLNSAASPLRLALLDSGLGEDLIGGCVNYLRQPAFGAGLKGVAGGDEERVAACVIDCLKQVAAENFRPDLIEGALNSSEFHLRELNTSNKGLTAILQAVQPWLYGGDPLAALDPESHLQRLRRDYAENPRLFADWVRTNLLENPSRLDVVLAPDAGLEALEAAQEAEQLRKHGERFAADPEKRRAAELLAEEVAAFQNTPDSPEALSKLPKLSLTDITPLPPPPPFGTDTIAGVPCSRTEVHSNGIGYLHFAFDFQHLPLGDLVLLPLYSRCLTELGTAKFDHLQFNDQVACESGGIRVDFETTATYPSGGQPGGTLAVMMIKTKCLSAKIDKVLDLLREMLISPRLGPADKVHQLLLEERSNEEADLIQSGNQIVTLRLKAAYSAMERAGEQMDGVSYLMQLRELEKLEPRELQDRIAALHRRMISRSNLHFHCGGDAGTLTQLRRRIPDFLACLPAGAPVAASEWPLLMSPGPEGLSTASPIQFVGMACRPDLQSTGNHYSHFVACRLINNDYLWEKVRMKGGAYGSSCAYLHQEGLLTFSSFRDPHLDQTLEIYRGAGDWLRNLSLSRQDLEQSVIGTLGKMAPPERPSSQVAKSFFRHLIGLSFEQRETFWREVLETTPEHLRTFGDALRESLAQETRICVLGGQKALQSSAHSLKITKLM